MTTAPAAPSPGAARADLPELATRKELGAYLGIATSTLAKWATDGTGRGPRITRLGGFVRYRREDVLEWINASAS